MEYDIFISYSRKNTEIVKQYTKALKDAGLNVWIDEDGIESGDEFKTKIVRAITKSKVFLFFSSVASNESPWTVKEVNVAVLLKKKIIPIKLDDSIYQESVLFDLAGLDYVEHKKSGLDKSIGKVLSAFGISKDGKNDASNSAKSNTKVKATPQPSKAGNTQTQSLEAVKTTSQPSKKVKSTPQPSKPKVTTPSRSISAAPKPAPIPKVVNYENSHEWVDLGLSVKWATCNVGANRPEEDGIRVAWGEIKEKSEYTHKNYSFLKPKTLFKKEEWLVYNKKGGLQRLQKEHDAASQLWGGRWRMPTAAELQELKRECGWELQIINGVRGFKVRSFKNGNSIFLPVSSSSYYNHSLKAHIYGAYWSSDIGYILESDAEYLTFSTSPEYLHIDIMGNERCYDSCIRAVF